MSHRSLPVGVALPPSFVPPDAFPAPALAAPEAEWRATGILKSPAASHPSATIDLSSRQPSPHAELDVARLQQELQWFYEKFNTEKVHRVPVIVREFIKRGANLEELANLNQDLNQRYGADLSSVASRWDEVVEQRNGKWFGHQIHLPQNSSLEQTQQSPIPHHSITNASIIFPPSSQRICTDGHASRPPTSTPTHTTNPTAFSAHPASASIPPTTPSPCISPQSREALSTAERERSRPSTPANSTQKALEIRISGLKSKSVSSLDTAMALRFRVSLGNDQHQTVDGWQGEIETLLFEMPSALTMLRVEVWMTEMWQEERQVAFLEQPVQALVEHGHRTIVATESHQSLITAHAKEWPLSTHNDSRPEQLAWGRVTVEAKTVIGRAMPAQAFQSALTVFQDGLEASTSHRSSNTGSRCGTPISARSIKSDSTAVKRSMTSTPPASSGTSPRAINAKHPSPQEITASSPASLRPKGLKKGAAGGGKGEKLQDPASPISQMRRASVEGSKRLSQQATTKIAALNALHHAKSELERLHGIVNNLDRRRLPGL